MSIKEKFKSTIGPQQYLFKNGKAAHFELGVYLTDVPEEISELKKEIKNGMPYIYQDPEDAIVDTTLQDKIRAAQADAVKRVIKEHEQGTVEDTTTDTGKKQLDTLKDPVTQGGSGEVANANAANVVASRPTSATLLNNLKAPATNVGVAGSSNVSDNAAGSGGGN
jgi:hypothetical protein